MWGRLPGDFHRGVKLTTHLESSTLIINPKPTYQTPLILNSPHSQPQTSNPQPQTSNPQPQTKNPQPRGCFWVGLTFGRLPSWRQTLPDSTPCPGSCSPAFTFWVSNFGFRALGFGFWVSGLGFRFGVWCLVFRVSSFGCRVSCFGFRNSSVGFRALGF